MGRSDQSSRPSDVTNCKASRRRDADRRCRYRGDLLRIPADGGWRCDGEVLHFEHHVNVRRELDALTVGQAQHLVVVQHRVHVLDPQRVHRAVADHPLVSFRRLLNHTNKPVTDRPQTPPPVLPPSWEFTSSARKVVPCVRRPAAGITAHSLPPSPRLRVHCASAGRRRCAPAEQPWLITSFIKPEVHSVSIRHQRRTEPRS